MNTPPDNTSSRVPLAPGTWVSRSDLTFRFSRSGGPGGQNVNKLNTKAELRLRPESLQGLSWRAMERLRIFGAHRITSDGELLIVAETERTQEANRQACLERLRALIEQIYKEPKVRRETRPSRGSVQKRLDVKKARSKIKKSRGQWAVDN